MQGVPEEGKPESCDETRELDFQVLWLRIALWSSDTEDVGSGWVTGSGHSTMSRRIFFCRLFGKGPLAPALFENTHNGSVSCYDTVSAEFLTKIINVKDESERFEKAQPRETSPTKNSRRDRKTPRETPKHESQDQETLETRRLGELLITAEFFFNDNKDYEIYVQCNWCTKGSTKGTIFWCGQTHSGCTALQVKNAQMTIEKGSQVIRALVQLRIVDQT